MAATPAATIPTAAAVPIATFFLVAGGNDFAAFSNDDFALLVAAFPAAFTFALADAVVDLTALAAAPAFCEAEDDAGLRDDVLAAGAFALAVTVFPAADLAAEGFAAAGLTGALAVGLRAALDVPVVVAVDFAVAIIDSID